MEKKIIEKHYRYSSKKNPTCRVRKNIKGKKINDMYSNVHASSWCKYIFFVLSNHLNKIINWFKTWSNLSLVMSKE